MERGEPYFEDGNVILMCGESPASVTFRVHRSVMARHSEVFESMFLVPQPETSMVETLDGCQVVRMFDEPVELSNLIGALYDGAKFSNERLEDFYYLAGILRLATKYFIAKLRTQAIEHLTQTWSHTLKGHDDMVEAALRAPLVGGLSYPRVHPLHVVSLAREVNVRIILPSAIYFLSLYPLEDLLRGDHPKLIVEHPSRPSSVLSPADLRDYTLMFQHRLDTILHFVRAFCGKRTALQACPSPSACSHGFAKLSSRLSRSWITRTGPLHYMSQAVFDLAEDSRGSVCGLCRRAFAQDVATLREKVWSELPSILGLPSWTELEAMDL
ncbi:BTB domain-containing protein [Mycena sanguinolenta]|uniref:BTB domain-containing protein n=1 Tax=Mycena sanguinolenta TaxID=230812 RepID=A0A8H6XR74_9AGAR|nr:BTB domain-containing protein [Mycena sanguinolenta]